MRLVKFRKAIPYPITYHTVYRTANGVGVAYKISVFPDDGYAQTSFQIDSKEGFQEIATEFNGIFN